MDNLRPVLPEILGISYLSLQLIDQLCKVRFGVATLPDNFLSYLATVFYFPKFFSGPIASLPEIDKQLLELDSKNSIGYGLNRILFGLFKKLVLAESLALSVHSVLDFNESYPGLTVLTGAMLYTLQLYFDFSGYSDIAIGVSALWGITLPENFAFPFRQKSWSDFWKSWHSSLTNWLWQYIFNPLYLFFGRYSINRVFALLICSSAVFAAMAFFNGLHSGFYISAGIFAFFYFCEVIFSARKNFLYGVLIFACFAFGLIYFRNADYDHYTWLTERLLDFENFVPSEWARTFFAPLAYGGTQQDFFNFSVSLLFCLLFLLFERKIAAIFFREKISYIWWIIFVLLLFTWGVFAGTERFIYMQF
jgi:D-alanyl-lipoteichoic acid acyltransferase DltB (MBOAT superfamily)